ncbi:hypothetical protein [Intestinibacter sp.]
MKYCSKCNCKINLSTRIKTLGSECVRMKCDKCGTVYEIKSKQIVKIINLLSFFMIFYSIYYSLNLMKIARNMRIGIVVLLLIVFYVGWNLAVSYFLGYRVIINGYSLAKNGELIDTHKTSQAEKIFNDILDKNGFDKKNIKLDIIIDSFEEFLHEKFSCYHDSIIYNIQPRDFIYKDLCCCTLVRQFETRDASGELNVERIYIQVYYKSNEVINKLYNIHSNYDSDKFNDFFEVVRNENSYWQVLKKYKPIKYKITVERF